MKVMLVSGSIGSGHDSLADACSTALGRLGQETRTLDAMRLLGDFNHRFGQWVFKTMIAIPGAYDAVHFASFAPGGPFARRMDEAAARRILPHLRDALAEWPAQIVLSVFATAASAADRLKAERPDLISVVFNTDACTHSLWVHDRTDLFLVTSDLSAATIRRFRPEADIAVVPAPVRHAFYDAPSREDARAALGVPDDATCVLLMSGAWGLGPLAGSARALAAEGHHVLAVAGSNRRTARRLAEIAAEERHVIAFGFTDRIPQLMAAADVVVTSSGDTCAEARVLNRPLVVLDVVPGHGRENVLHELELGGAEVCSANPEAIARSVRAVLRAGPPATRPTPSPTDWEDSFLAALAKFGIDLKAGPQPLA